MQAGNEVLEVGCGTAAPARLLAGRTKAARIVGVDISPVLRDEGTWLAERDGFGDRIELVEGNAETLPFADAAFDVTYSVTVLEECRVEAALAELLWVPPPGGRIGVLVRAVDLAQVVNVEGSDELRSALAANRGPVVPAGCADASLYRRMAAREQRGLDEVTVRAQARRLARLDPRVLEEWITDGWLEGFQPDFAAIGCPVLLLRADPAVGSKCSDRGVEIAREKVRDLTVAQVEGAGHIIRATHPIFAPEL